MNTMGGAKLGLHPRSVLMDNLARKRILFLAVEKLNKETKVTHPILYRRYVDFTQQFAVEALEEAENYRDMADAEREWEKLVAAAYERTLAAAHVYDDDFDAIPHFEF